MTSPVLSRYLVIVLALGVAAYRAWQGATIEAVGLLALGAGLLCLRLAAGRPWLRRLAWVAFGVTALSCLVVLMRMPRFR